MLKIQVSLRNMIYDNNVYLSSDTVFLKKMGIIFFLSIIVPIYVEFCQFLSSFCIPFMFTYVARVHKNDKDCSAC